MAHRRMKTVNLYDKHDMMDLYEAVGNKLKNRKMRRVWTKARNANGSVSVGNDILTSFVFSQFPDAERLFDPQTPAREFVMRVASRLERSSLYAEALLKLYNDVMHSAQHGKGYGDQAGGKGDEEEEDSYFSKASSLAASAAKKTVKTALLVANPIQHAKCTAGFMALQSRLKFKVTTKAGRIALSTCFSVDGLPFCIKMTKALIAAGATAGAASGAIAAVCASDVGICTSVGKEGVAELAGILQDELEGDSWFKSCVTDFVDVWLSEAQDKADKEKKKAQEKPPANAQPGLRGGS